MYTLRDGLARYAPRCSRACRSRRFVLQVLPVRSHVTPSTPGAAFGLQRPNAARSRSTVDVVQERGEPRFLVPVVLPGARGPAHWARSVRLCVRGAFCWPRSPWPGPFPPPPPHAASHGLVRRLRRYYGPVRLPRPSIAGLRPWPSRRGPPATHAGGRHGISRFSRMESSVHAWGLRPRRVHQRLALSPPAVLPSASITQRRHPELRLISRLNTRLHVPLSTLRRALTDADA